MPDAPVFGLPTGGSVRGVAQANSTAFLGIRFGSSPTGPLRFRPPQAAPALTGGIFNATTPPPFCTQVLPANASGKTSEDCLFLNVYTPFRAPPRPADRLLPVLVWIHGGCYVVDGISNPLFNGSELVEAASRSAEPVVVVAVAYRVGIYGFLGGEELRARSIAGGAANTTGVWGLLDQRLGLRWVQDTIRAFGGDARRVTIFGHSAGAGSVSAHLVMPNSVGLFSRAGLLSGSFSNWAAHSADAAQANFDRLLKLVNCSAVGGGAESSSTRRRSASAPLECLLRFADKQPTALRDVAHLGWAGVAPCRDGCAFAPQVL